jgi:hypothetical protein
MCGIQILLLVHITLIHEQSMKSLVSDSTTYHAINNTNGSWRRTRKKLLLPVRYTFQNKETTSYNINSVLKSLGILKS